MATENLSTAAIIDYVVATMGLQTADAAARADALRYVKEAERTIVSAAPDWDWLYNESAYAFVAGENTQTLDASFAGIDVLWDESNVLIDHIERKTFDAVYRGDSVTGTPSVFTVDYRENVADSLVIRYWPTPSGNSNGTKRCKLRPLTLTDSTESYSIVPKEYRHLLSLYALKQLTEADGNLPKSQLYGTDYVRGLAAMQGHFVGEEMGA